MTWNWQQKHDLIAKIDDNEEIIYRLFSQFVGRIGIRWNSNKTIIRAIIRSHQLWYIHLETCVLIQVSQFTLWIINVKEEKKAIKITFLCVPDVEFVFLTE